MRGCTGLALFIVVLGVVLGAIVGGAGSAAADGGARAAERLIDRPAFTATPGELVVAAKAALAAAPPRGRVWLRSERDVSFDAQGRMTERTHEIYVLRGVTGPGAKADDGADAADGAEDLDDADDLADDRADVASVMTLWRPSRQDRPVLRLRVIDPAGAVRELDPGQITDEAMSPQGSPTVDLQMTSGSLPKVVPGSVIETESVIRDREPPFGGASAWAFPEAGPGTTISYSVPVGQRVHRIERKLPPGTQVRHSVAGGRERWTYELPAEPPEAEDEREYEPGTPFDATAAPKLGITTAASWAAVARAYRAVIDRRIAEGKVVLPSSLTRAASREAVEAIATWVRGRVHAPPLGFSNAPYTPLPPAVVLTRGAQSATDVATLLVALLRQAGIRADVALIANGPVGDIDAEFPGIAQFDHVIVRARLARGDVWIDLAEDLVAPGRLPPDDQGRRALVIADDTTGLITTPVPVARDNTMHVEHAFVAAERGPAALTVVVSATGEMETMGRRMYRRGIPAPPRRTGSRKNEYYGGEQVRVVQTEPTDLTTPFTITREIKDSRWVYSNGDHLAIELPLGDVLAYVPMWLQAKPKTARVHDYVWRTPHVEEVETRIELPPGFAPPELPPERVVHLGPATFTERRRIDGHALIVLLRLDTGKPRWTAAEVTAMQSAAPALVGETLRIQVDRTAVALRHAGKFREAAAEDARMIALHPQEALHHEQLAELLIAAGLGDAARREARTAVQLAPSDPTALSVLGWVLHHDRVGRDFVYDWDRAGALEVLRKARAIDPRHSGAAFELAQILERSPSGALYARGADMPGAIEAWTAARETASDPDDIALRLAEVLLWAGQPIASETLARTVAASMWRDVLIVAAVADTQGAKAAIAEARKLRTGDQQRALIGDAIWVETDRQHYDVMRGMLAEVPGAPPLSPMWATVLPRIASRPDVATGSSDPRVALEDLFIALGDPARKTPVFADAVVERAMRSDVRRAIPAPSFRGGSQRLFSDVARSSGFQIEGGDGVWRAKAPEKTAVTFTPYFVLDHGAVKTIGTSARFALIGHHLLGLDLGDAAAASRARRVLDFARRDLAADTGYRPTLFKRLWGSGKPASRDAIELAAALLAGDLDADRVTAIATRCAPATPEARLACHGILSYTHRDHHRWADAVKEYEAAIAADPSLLSFLLGGYARSLERLGRSADADRLVDGYLATYPDDGFAVMTRYQLAFERGNAAEARRAFDALAHVAKPEAYQLNAAAWNQLFPGGDLARGRELAKQAVELARFSPEYRNTLALVDAELGDVGAAVRDNLDAMARNDTDEPRLSDWCVVARIAEQVGYTDDAIAIYRKVARPGAEPFTLADYAARRLAALHAP